MNTILKERKSKFDRLSVFALLWGVTNVFHLFSFPYKINLSSPLAVGLLIAAVALILLSRSVVVFIILVIASLLHTFEWIPMTPNHFILEFMINVGIILSFLWCILSHYRGNGRLLDINSNEFRNQLLITFAPVARISLFVLYLYGVLHKLNYDYFNPNISCSGFLLDNVSERIPFLPNSSLTKNLAIWSTLIIETSIPLFFLFKKTRSLGIFLGLAFHFFLTFCSHPGLYSFSCLLFALFYLFTPPSFSEALNSELQGHLKDRWGIVSLVFKSIWVIIGIVLLLFPIANIVGSAKMTVIGLIFWFFWGMFVIGVYFLIVRRHRLEEASFLDTYRIKPAFLWIIPVILLFNGASPYLGLKTQTSFSMFSNLRTEGGATNHLFIPNTFHLTKYQEDLVDILETNAPPFDGIVQKDQLIPYFEFCRIASEIKQDYYIRYQRNGVENFLEVKNGISNQPEVTQPQPFLLTKLLRFRPIDKGPCHCKH